VDRLFDGLSEKRDYSDNPKTTMLQIIAQCGGSPEVAASMLAT
jgi:hypothetical protein